MVIDNKVPNMRSNWKASPAHYPERARNLCLQAIQVGGRIRRVGTELELDHATGLSKTIQIVAGVSEYMPEAGRQRVSDTFPEIRLEIAAMRLTWTNNAQARQHVYCAVLAGLGVVLLAIFVDVLRYLDVHHYRASFLSLTTDRSLPELVMDVLVLTAAGLTTWMFTRTRLRGFLFVASLLYLIALDDFFSFHESLGSFLVQQLEIPDVGNLDGQALGELTFLASFGLVCGLFFVWAAWGWHPDNLAVLLLYGAAFTLFAGFSGGVDFLHSLAQTSFMDRFMGWVEEGGEILMITALTSMTILQSHGRLPA